MINEEIAADLRAGVNVNRGQHPRQMVDQPGQKEQPGVIEPVRHAVEAERPDPGIEQDLPARARRRARMSSSANVRARGACLRSGA